MKKRIISIVFALCLALFITLPALGAATLSNFGKLRTYNGEFSDVSPDAWYYAGVRSVFEYGIMDGKSEGSFDPAGNITIAETIKLAAMLDKGYNTGSMDFEPGSPWYAPYVDYAMKNGIPVGSYSNYNAAATRADFAYILAGALPDEAITPMNRIDDGAIPDVAESYNYGPSVYKLYRAGVLTGSDSDGTFYPGRTLSRAEAAAIIMRLINADTRVSNSLAAGLTGEQIYKLASPAVFYMEIFNSNNEPIKTGSGFFISENGLAVTNYHVIMGGAYARITTDSGEVHDVVGIYDYDWKKDIALIQIEGTGYKYLEMADSDRIQTGETIYTLGSPLGLQATFSRGIVSQALREIDGAEYIQLDAPISSGSSGGALLDTSGRVVGVTSATAVDAQNINLATPINTIAQLSAAQNVPLKSILISATYYHNYYPAPDFGAYFGVQIFNMDASRGSVSYSYRVSDLPGGAEDALDKYTYLVLQNLFDYVGSSEQDGNKLDTYYNSRGSVVLSFGLATVKGQNCITVTVM